MRILQINNFHYRRGGSETVYLNTSSLLRLNGHQVYNFSQVNPQNEYSEDQSYFVQYQDFLNKELLQKIKSFSKFIYSREAKANLEKLIQDKKPEIAHLHNFIGGLTLSILAILKKYKIPIVVTLHDYKLLCPVYTFLDKENKICEKCITGNYINCITKRCNKGSLPYSLVIASESYVRDLYFNPAEYYDKIICVSQFALQKHSTKKYSKKLTHIYNFSYHLENEPPQIQNKGFYLYFGRLSREKGILTLIDSFKDIKDQKLLIAGTGPLESSVLELIKDYPHIEHVGFKSGDELKSLIQNAAFVIVPSEWYENNPMTIVESYFLGTPVIGASIGGIPEIVIDGQTGYTFPYGNKELLSQSIIKSSSLPMERYADMAQMCRNFASQNFSSKVHYQKLIAVYEDLIINSSK